MKDAKPGGAIGLASLLKDRFVAVEASFDGGSLTTKPLHFEGAAFKVNCDTSFGTLGIRILDQKSRPIEGYNAMIEGVDMIEHAVTFDRAISKLGEQPIRIEFTLSNAQLYSFSVQ